MTDHRLTRRVLKALAHVFIGAAVAAVALPLVPDVHHRMGPGSVAAGAGVGPGRTTFVAPPLGTVSAATHASPIEIDVSLTRIDLNALQAALGSESDRRHLAGDIEGDIRALGRRLALQLLVAGLILGTVAGAVLPRRTTRTFLATAAGGLLAAGAVVALTAASFDEKAFDEPRFTGALARAPDVIEAVERGGASFERLGDRYEVLAARVSSLLSVAAQPFSAASPDALVVLHISDVHSNPLGLEFARRLVEAFEVDVVIDTGDLTSFGSSIEASIGTLVSRFDVPYVFVPGNHDSPANRRAIGGREGVSLVDGAGVELEGLDILGWPDPTFTADNSITTEQGNEIRMRASEDVAAAVTAQRPDVLAVHDVRLAELSFGQVPLVLAGHTHERSLSVRDGTLVLTVGSTGATGLGSFISEADIPYEAQIVYFDGALPVALDYIRFTGVGDSFEVDRRLLDGEATGEATVRNDGSG